MKKFTLIALFAFLMFASVNAQTFTVSPSNSISGVVEENGYLNLQIDFNNTSSSNITFEWETVSNNLNSNWSVTLCDYPSCFSSVPASGRMDPITPGNYGFLKLTIGAGSNLGMGDVSFNVWDAANPAVKELVTFNVDAVVGIEDEMLEGSVSVYPNPAQNQLFISHDFSTLETGTVTLMDLTGAKLIQENVGTSSTHSLDISNLPAGIYMLRYETESASMVEKVLKTN